MLQNVGLNPDTVAHRYVSGKVT